MAAPVLQFHQSGTITTPASSATALTLNQTPTLGDALFLVVCADQGAATPTVSSIVQTNATWVKADNVALGAAGLELWYALNVPGNASTTVTVNWSASIVNSFGYCFVEYNNISTSGALDKHITNNGVSTSPDTGTTATTTQNVELWVGGIAQFGGATDPAYSAPTNGFAIEDQQEQHQAASTREIQLCSLVKVVSSTGTANCSVTSTVNGSWVGIMATFKGTVSSVPNQVLLTGAGTQ